jgi:hypothetical protein
MLKPCIGFPTNDRIFLVIINSPESLKKLFKLLDQRLIQRLEVYAIGAANLIAQRFLQRQTQDVDIISPPELSPEVQVLIRQIGTEHELNLKWLNTGPARDERFLSPGWKDRSTLFFKGKHLSVWLLGRADMLGLKLAAALDRTLPDEQDILAMNPTKDEWEIARLWARAYDANVDWPIAIDRLVRELQDRQGRK